MTNSQPKKPTIDGSPAPAVPAGYGNPNGGWIKPDQIFLDLDLSYLKIARALNQSDDTAVWDQLRESHDPRRYLDSLTSLAGSYSIDLKHFRDPTRQATRHTALISIPFLMPPERWSVEQPTAPDRAAAAEIFRLLRDWVGDQQQVCVVTACTPYSQVSRWSPVTQREYLQVLAREAPKPSVPWLSPLADVPSDFPQLAFMHAGLARWFGFPQLPEPDVRAEKDWRLRCQLAAHLAYLCHRPVQPQDVLLPSNFAEAVLEGVRLWLADVLRRRLICAWEVHVADRDLVTLELRRRQQDEPTVMLPLRLHQIGWTGMDLLMTDIKQGLGAPVVPITVC